MDLLNSWTEFCLILFVSHLRSTIKKDTLVVVSGISGMKSYPVMWGLFHINHGLMESIRGFVFGVAHLFQNTSLWFPFFKASSQIYWVKPWVSLNFPSFYHHVVWKFPCKMFPRYPSILPLALVKWHNCGKKLWDAWYSSVRGGI